jgi:GNAT superfamily N-acetyltransferase
MLPFQLRDCTSADLDVTFAITEEAMRTYVELTWGTWNHDEQWQRHRDSYKPDTHRLILAGDFVAGLIAVEEDPSHLWLVKLYLLAGYRGKGLGSAVLRTVQENATLKRKPVRLRILRVNKAARRLYERHGFRVSQETPERLFMECGA